LELAAILAHEKGIVTLRDLSPVVDQINATCRGPNRRVGGQIILIGCVKVAKQTRAGTEATIRSQSPAARPEKSSDTLPGDWGARIARG
jgi:hypothetical protein